MDLLVQQDVQLQLLVLLKLLLDIRKEKYFASLILYI